MRSESIRMGSSSDASIENRFRNMYADELETEQDQTHIESGHRRADLHLDENHLRPRTECIECADGSEEENETGFDSSQLSSRCL